MVVTTSEEAVVRTLTREDMIKERTELLEAAGMSEDELRERGAAWDLDAHHRGLLAQINGLDFLLANSAA